MSHHHWLIVAGCTWSLVLGCTSVPSSPPATPEAIAQNSQMVSPDYSRTPVLFIHGSGLDSRTWEPMIRHLVSTGYSLDYLRAIDLVPNDGANRQAAEKFIAPAIESLLTQARTSASRAGHRETVPQRVDIVAHSMGAVSSRWYMAKMRPERVRTWVAIAGANYGTNAICPYPSPGNSEICPAFATDTAKNPLQITLNGTPDKPIDTTPYGLGKDAPRVPSIAPDQTRSVLYLTVRIEPDFWIKPERSAMIDGAGGFPITVPAGVPVQETKPGNYLFTAQVEHDPLPQHPDLIRLVFAMLTARDNPRVKP